MSEPDVAEQHERLLALRLVEVAAILRAECAELVRTSGFEGSWSVLRSLPPGGLAAAARIPALHAWVTTSENLVRCGAHARYPGAHATRHLRSLSHLALALASLTPDGTSGEAPLLGRRYVPLLCGRALLRIGELDRGSLGWSVQGGALRLATESSGASLEVDLSEPARWEAKGPLEIVPLPAPGSITVDPWTPEYAGTGDPGGTTEGVVAALVSSLRDLGASDAALVATLLRCVSIASPGAPWIAGLGRLPAGDPIGPEALLELAFRDRLRRQLELGRFTRGRDVASPFVTAGHVRAALVELGAHVLARRHRGRDPDAGALTRWRTLAGRLSAVGDSDELLRDLGLDGLVEGPSPGAAPAPAELPLDRAGAPPAAARLRKTRHAMREEVDWTAVDALSDAGAEALEQLLGEAAPEAAASEERAFSAAIAAYHLGRFDDASTLLERCLAFDPDVEQYWLLLAFTLRHLGHRDRFERIVFDDARSAAELLGSRGTG